MASTREDEPRSLSEICDRLDEIKRLLESQARPFVLIDVIPRGHVNLLYMRIRNVGLTPAYEISVDFTDQVEIARRAASEYGIFNGFSVLAPGETIAFLYGSAVEILTGAEGTKQFTGTVTYSDVEGQTYQEKIAVNVEAFRNLALVVEGEFEDKLRRGLEKIQRELTEISRYFREQRMRELKERLADGPESGEEVEEPSE